MSKSNIYHEAESVVEEIMEFFSISKILDRLELDEDEVQEIKEELTNIVARKLSEDE